MANLVEQEAEQVFGHYQVLGVLGEGGMGRLYLAEHRGAEGGAAIVALRNFHPQLTASPHFQKLLPDAVRIAAGLRHPNIAATHELEEFDGRHFLTTEYLPGESLLSILARCVAPTPMPPGIAAALVHQCAEALRYAHEIRDVHGAQMRVVHRDIRPANVFVTYQGMVKVLGTGAGPLRAHVIEIRGATTEAFAYNAPEAMDGGVSDVRTDIFSMGVVLWECLTGRQLFHAETLAKTRDAVRARYIEPPSVFNPEVPPGLDEVALRALARDPRRRYQSAKEMSLAIDTAIVGLGRRPTSAAIAEWMERLFGAERASLKTQIARGSAVPGALARLRLLGGDAVPTPAGRAEALNALRSPGPGQPALPPNGRTDSRRDTRASSHLAVTTSPPPFHPPQARGGAPISSAAIPTLTAAGGPPMSRSGAGPSSSPGPTPSSPVTPALGGDSTAPSPGGLSTVAKTAIGVGVAIAVVIGVTMVGFHGDAGTSGGSSPVAAVPVGSLQIISTPPGAQVLIDGDPSGLATPARVTGLRGGRKVEIRVDKPGYKSEKQVTDIPATGSRTLSFTLTESMGTVRLEGIPGHAATYVDDVVMDGNQPLSLPVGPHRLRVEVSGRLFSSMKLDVRPGTQAVPVRASEGNTP